MDGPRALARPLRHDADLGPLLDRIGDARCVLIGEASHGTHDYYDWRARLTRRLIAERGFSFVGVEGDWPDCYRVTTAVTGVSGEPPLDALRAFARWPTWMWANADVAAFTQWLAEYNGGLPEDDRVGFYGLDVYSLWESLRAVLDYLAEYRPDQVQAALAAYQCFEPYAQDPQAYARATRLVPTSCEDEVVSLLEQLRPVPPGAGRARDAAFDASQNALVAEGAERYYRAMVRGGPDSWNIRDQHMAETLDRLLQVHGPGAKAVVWEHNTHVGDARYTDMAEAGMVNVGQLARERYGEETVVLVGFAGHAGSVIAAPAWGALQQRMTVPRARGGSLEDLLRRELTDPTALFLMPGGRAADWPDWLAGELEHRAIGVVYHPERERWGNYVPSVVGRRYDALLWIRDTTALEPLSVRPGDTREEETWPWAV
ncbi:MAG: protein-L-isoaspartate O-methyltransferase [Mycobacterium sp.]|nr:protein-L-isoaspartate O-methyltransferase [Mycobacterium sp.]